MKIKQLLFAFIMAGGCLVGCSDKDKPAPGPEPGGDGKSRYVFVAYSVGSEGVESAPYIISADSVTGGTVGLAGGIETDAYSFIPQNNRIFAAVWGDQGPVTPYGLNDKGEIVEIGNTVNAPTAAIYGPVGDKFWVGGGFAGSFESPNATLFRYDAENLMLSGRNTIDLSKAAVQDEWPTWYGVFPVDDDKLYIPYDLSPANGTSKFLDSTWVLVVNYPSLTFKEIIRDGRSGPIGSWFGMHGLKQIEDGDVYAWSGAVGSKNPSAIMRIKKGTSVFDPNYFFNIEEKTGGLKLSRGEYIGGTKFLLSVFATKADEGAWSARTRMAIADVKDNSFAWVNGIPEHVQMGYKQKIYVEDDKKTAHYVMKDDAGKHYVYNINIETAQASRGLEFVNIADITTISKLTY